MLNVESNAAARFGLLTRRDWLRVGFLGLGGLALGDLFRLRAADSARKDNAVILLFVHGGPGHLETYDLKPDAPSEIRGPCVGASRSTN